MIQFSGQAILLDIEGTTSSISFVYDVMFPFVRRELMSFLEKTWGADSVASACQQIARDAGHSGLQAWCGNDDAQVQMQTVVSEVMRLMDDDVKSTGLKSLQGLIWTRGFESGELCAHLYEDVGPAIKSWTAQGRQVHIYSSGSVQAQKLFFGHTIDGDYLEYFGGHYDTTTGPKRAATSYRLIAQDVGMSPKGILFLSDVSEELDAATSAGMQTGLCVRPGNANPSSDKHVKFTDFSQIVLV